VQPLKRRTRELLTYLLAVPGLDSGRPWLPDEVAPLPALPARLAAPYRSGRQGQLSALGRRGLVARTADGRYYLTPAAVTGGEGSPCT
jgi:hypothetical protein